MRKSPSFCPKLGLPFERTGEIRMASFDLAVAKTLIREGGARFTDNPDDRGGATKYGISQRAYPNEDIANLTEDQAKAIYKQDYWDRVSGDKLKSQAVAENVFDT